MIEKAVQHRSQESQSEILMVGLTGQGCVGISFRFVKLGRSIYLGQPAFLVTTLPAKGGETGRAEVKMRIYPGFKEEKNKMTSGYYRQKGGR